MITTVNVEGYGPCTIEHYPPPPEKQTTECWCGGNKWKDRAALCCECYALLPEDISKGLHAPMWRPEYAREHYGMTYEEAYESSIKHLAMLKGFGDDTRTAAQRIEDEQFQDVVTGLPGFLQELITGQVVEKAVNATETDNVYAHVIAGLPLELQKALSGE